jgi:hypothetical protein
MMEKLLSSEEYSSRRCPVILGPTRQRQQPTSEKASRRLRVTARGGSNRTLFEPHPCPVKLHPLSTFV